MKRLICFTHTLIRPSGITDPFLLAEQPWLNEHFDRVDVVGEGGVAQLDDTAAQGFALRAARAASLRAALMTPFRPELWRELGRMLRDRKLTIGNAKRLVFFTWRGMRMYLHAQQLTPVEGSCDLYSYWLSFDAYAAALFHRHAPDSRFVARGHAFDVDVERTPLNPYLMKQVIADEAAAIHPISHMGKEQLMSYLQGRVAPQKVRVLAMGSAGRPVDAVRPAPRFASGVLEVVSCATVLPIKQLHVLAQALQRWQGMPLRWTHIGDGPEMEPLRQYCEEHLSRKPNVVFDFVGTLPAHEVAKLYASRAFDVFINCSRKEGVPVAIMETMRHGVLTIAPRVGGLPELVTPDVGWLYDPRQGEDGILAALEALCALDEEATNAMRQSAKQRWDAHYCAWALLPQLFAPSND